MEIVLAVDAAADFAATVLPTCNPRVCLCVYVCVCVLCVCVRASVYMWSVCHFASIFHVRCLGKLKKIQIMPKETKSKNCQNKDRFCFFKFLNVDYASSVAAASVQ